MSAAAYLEWERQQPDKHELHDGEVYAMAGGSPRHNLLASAIAAELRTAARALGCHVLSSDQRIAAPPGERYVYADAVLVCGAVQTEPTAVVEHYRREGDAWRYQVLVAGDTIVLSNGARVAVDAIYEGVFEIPGP